MSEIKNLIRERHVNTAVPTRTIDTSFSGVEPHCATEYNYEGTKTGRFKSGGEAVKFLDDVNKLERAVGHKVVSDKTICEMFDIDLDVEKECLLSEVDFHKYVEQNIRVSLGLTQEQIDGFVRDEANFSKSILEKHVMPYFGRRRRFAEYKEHVNKNNDSFPKPIASSTCVGGGMAKPHPATMLPQPPKKVKTGGDARKASFEVSARTSDTDKARARLKLAVACFKRNPPTFCDIDYDGSKLNEELEEIGLVLALEFNHSEHGVTVIAQASDREDMLKRQDLWVSLSIEARGEDTISARSALINGVANL